MIKKYYLCIIFILLLSFNINSLAAQQDKKPIEIFQPTEKPFGKSYEDHVIDFWTSMLSITSLQNPLNDESGKKCSYDRNISNSSVFYLPVNLGGSTAKTCEMPQGMGIFIPIISVTASDGETQSASISDLHKIAKNDQDHVSSLSLKIDDNEFEMKDLQKFRIHTKEFQVTYPADALFGAREGLSNVVADGYYVITKPLAPGNYTIQSKGSIVCLTPDCIEPTFASENRFDLIVK